MAVVEATFTGEVSQESAAAALDRMGLYVTRFGLKLEQGAAFAEGHPATSRLLELAVEELARRDGVSEEQMLRSLESALT